MLDKRDLTEHPWNKFVKVYSTLQNDDTVRTNAQCSSIRFLCTNESTLFQGLFSDLAAYMLMATKSVDALNEKLDAPVPALQFRPNILVSTQKPFEEDNWEWIKIGEKAVIRNVKPCTRSEVEQYYYLNCSIVESNDQESTFKRELMLRMSRLLQVQVYSSESGNWQRGD